MARPEGRQIPLAQMKKILAPLGMTVKLSDGEYRYNFKGGSEASAGYTNDSLDAINSATDMWKRRQHSRPGGLSQAQHDATADYIESQLRGKRYRENAPTDFRAKMWRGFRVVTEKPNKGGSETRFLFFPARGTILVGYVTKIRNTRTDTHPYKAYHVGFDGKVIKESGRVFYEDSRYAQDGAFPGGKEAAFAYATGGRAEFYKNPRKNPPPLFGARSRKVGGSHGAAHLIGLEVYEIRYRHATDGKDYKHKFETGVIMLGMPDGSIKVESATGVRLWEEINV